MATAAGNSFWVVSFVTAIPAALASFPLERRRKARMPGTQPFTWGIYVGINVLLLGSVIIVGGGVLMFSGDSAPAGGIVLLAIGGVYATAGFNAVRRSRAGLIVSTALSMNLFWWIANAIYIRNRWMELNGKWSPTIASKNRSTPEDESTAETAPSNSAPSELVIEAGDPVRGIFE